MSPEIDAKEIIGFLYLLLPGFVAAWLFFGLTAHPKADWFERTVQALIFTGIIQAATFLIRTVLEFFGQLGFSLGPWTIEVNLVWSLVLALLLGIMFSAMANADWPHKLLRDRGITTRTSFPSEWFSVFCQHKRWVVLHLSGSRRLFGWPNEWPDRSDRGHFVIEQPEWYNDEGQREPVKGVDRIVVRAEDVEMVEFLLFDSEVAAEKKRVETVQNLHQVSE